MTIEKNSRRSIPATLALIACLATPTLADTAPQPLPTLLDPHVRDAITLLRQECPTLPAGFETEAHVCRVLAGTEPSQTRTEQLLDEIAEQVAGIRVSVERQAVATGVR